MTDASSTDTVPRAHPDVETAFVGGEAVLLNVDTGAVFALNPSASAIWLLLDGEHTAGAVAHELSDIVQIAPDVLEPDVERALGEFEDLGLLERPSAAAKAAFGPAPFLPPPDP